MRRVVFLALVLVVVAAGCGSSSTVTPLDHDRYVAALNAIYVGEASRDASSRFFRLASGGPAGNPQSRDYRSEEECKVGARAFADDVTKIVADVAALNPPIDIADVHRFVTHATTSASLIEELADDVAAGRVSCGQEWNHRAYGLPSTEKAQEALEEYRERGYQLRALAGD